MIKQRRKRDRIKLQQSNGDFVTDPHIIGFQVSHCFQQLFVATPYHIDEELFHDYPSLINDEDNMTLTTPPDANEILVAIKSLDPDSAPGPDGFTGHFYTSCWNII